MVTFKLDKKSRTPYYTQLVEQFELAAKKDQLMAGDILPSMNALAEQLSLSKETVKKTYSILRDRGLVESHHGKGFYVSEKSRGKYLRVLVISDVNSIYKQILLGAFQDRLSERGDCDTTVLLHNQDVNILRYYLDRNLDHYDWFVVFPHFPLDEKTQKEVRRQLKRIPNRRLILLDRWTKDLPGNYGAVYQDFDNDAFDALVAHFDAIKSKGRLNVMTLNSLYKDSIQDSIRRFAQQYGIEAVFNTGEQQDIQPGDICIPLSSQHDNGLVSLAKRIEKHKLSIGRDVFIICYNDFPLNELVFGGLSTMSTDFAKMGESAADMILSGKLRKLHNPFSLIRRKTF